MVFTCVTDTGRLVWDLTYDNIKHSFHSPAQINVPVTEGVFTLTLLNVTNTTYQSTAVAHNISVDYNWTTVKCSDAWLSSTSNNKQLFVIIGKKPFSQEL